MLQAGIETQLNLRQSDILLHTISNLSMSEGI